MAERDFEPEIIGFCCHYCAYAAADLAGAMRLSYPVNVKIIELPCTGRVDVVHLLHALEKGADGVFVAGWLEGTCHYLEGNLRAKKRVAYAQEILRQVGLDGDRLAFYNLSSAEGPRFVQIASELTERIRALGPNPLRRRGPKTRGEEHPQE